jgi:hypothetical protein
VGPESHFVYCGINKIRHMKNLTIEDINKIMEIIDNTVEMYWSEFDAIKAALIEAVDNQTK